MRECTIMRISTSFLLLQTVTFHFYLWRICLLLLGRPEIRNKTNFYQQELHIKCLKRQGINDVRLVSDSRVEYQQWAWGWAGECVPQLGAFSDFHFFKITLSKQKQVCGPMWPVLPLILNPHLEYGPGVQWPKIISGWKPTWMACNTFEVSQLLTCMKTLSQTLTLMED